MKFLRFILKSILVLALLLIVSVITLFIVDHFQTDYLHPTQLENGNNNSYLISGANVVPMTSDTILRNQMVLIEDGIIRKIGSTIVANDFQVIDGKGMYLAPGLTDMHVHVWDEYELGLYLSKGVTAVRNVWGMPMHLRMKNSISENELISPTFYTSGPKLTGPEFIGADNLQIYSPDEAVEKVRGYSEKGYDFIKSYYGLPEDIFNAIVEESEKLDMDIVAHPSQKVPYSFHFNPQIITIEHTEDVVQHPLNYELDSTKLEEVIHEYINSPNTSHCPTLMAFYNIYRMLNDSTILNSESVKYINPAIQVLDSKSQFERWQSTRNYEPDVQHRIENQHAFHLYIIKRMNDSGVNIVCGTDAGIGVTTPGYSIHEELALYKQAGLSNFEALKTATANVSKTHSVFQNLGTIETGKQANLLLLKANPLEDLNTLTTPTSVWVNGVLISETELQAFDAKAKERNNLGVTVLRYLENMMVEM